MRDRSLQSQRCVETEGYGIIVHIIDPPPHHGSVDGTVALFGCGTRSPRSLVVTSWHDPAEYDKKYETNKHIRLSV